MRSVVVILLLLLGTLENVHSRDDDDDDDDSSDTGFGSQLTDVMDRAKTREVERMLHTSWCVVGGPSCTSPTRGGISQELIDLNRFSLCLCRASASQSHCSLRIHFPIGEGDHSTVEKDFSLVFYWPGSVKDFYCTVSRALVLTCRFSHAILIPISSRGEVSSFFNKTQRTIEERSECDEFCSRFRCIFEGWVNFGHSLSYNQIYDKCVNQGCTTTKLSSSTTTASTTTKHATTSKSAESARRVNAKPRTITKPTTQTHGDRSASVKDGNHIPDPAKQDGDDLDDSSTLIAGLVGGMLALALLALAAFVILLWRRKRKQENEKRVEPSMKFSASNGAQTSNESNLRNNTKRNPISAVNPLAALCLEHHRRSDVKPLTSTSSLEETYATLSECQMNQQDNPALNVSLNKGEELLLSQGTTNPAFVLEGVYAAPTNQNCANRESSTDDDYLEPVLQAERYVSLPSQYMEPVHENGDEYLEPVPVESAYVGPSYMRMESTVSGKSMGRSALPLTDDIQYEVIHSAENNYYNM